MRTQIKLLSCLTLLAGVTASSAEAQSVAWSDSFTAGTNFTITNTSSVNTTGGRRVATDNTLGNISVSLSTGAGTLDISQTGFTGTSLFYGSQNSSNPTPLNVIVNGTGNVELEFSGFSGTPPLWIAVDLVDNDNSFCRHILSAGEISILHAGTGGTFSTPISGLSCTGGTVAGYSGVVDGVIVAFDDSTGGPFTATLDEVRITGGVAAGSLNGTTSFTAANGASDSQTFTVANGAGASAGLVVYSINFGGADASLFSLGTASGSPCGGLPFIIHAGQSCELLVQFAPDAGESSGAKSASLDLTSNNSPALSQALSGTVTSTNSVTLTPAVSTFTPTLVNTNGNTVTFTVTNGSSQQLNSLTPSITGANPTSYTIVAGGTCGSTLPAGSSCTVNVRFNPTGVVTQTTYTTAALRIASSNHSPITNLLRGTTGATVQQIPTVGEWGMMIMMLMLAASMLVAMKRQNEGN